MLEIKSYGKIELILDASKQFNLFGELKIKQLSVPWLKVYDLIRVSESKSGKFQFFSNAAEISNRENVIVKTAEYFFTENPSLSQGIKIVLDKKIPLGSGLSSRSSNAVATFKLMHKYFNLPYTETDILRFARIVSRDGAFFVYNRAAHASKINGQLKFMPYFEDKISNFYLHFNYDINPDIKVVLQQFLDHYRYYKKQTHKNGSFFNDFELPTFDVYPRLYSQFLELRKKFKYVMLCGAGSTFICFNKI